MDDMWREGGYTVSSTLWDHALLMTWRCNLQHSSLFATKALLMRRERCPLYLVSLVCEKSIGIKGEKVVSRTEFTARRSVINTEFTRCTWYSPAVEI